MIFYATKWNIPYLMKSMHNLFLLIVLSLFMVSCGSKASKKSLEGKYITNIKNNDLITADGKTYTLPVKDDGRVFYLIRHAEKDTTIQSSDPPLSPLGERRTMAIYDMFRGTDLDLVYSTMYVRTISTVQEIADQKGMNIKPYAPKDLRDVHSYIVDSTDAKRILIVGHSNTTPVLANFLSDTKYFNAAFDEKDYDNLLIVIDNGPEDKELIPVKFKP